MQPFPLTLLRILDRGPWIVALILAGCGGNEFSPVPGGQGGNASAGSAGTWGNNGGTGNAGGTAGSAAVAQGGGSGAAGSGAGGSGSCDPTRNPSEEPCLVSDEHAVFVAPDGNDDGPGALAAPLATLSKAVEVAAGDKIVIVCNAEYDEHVIVSARVRAYGGFGCPATSGAWEVEVGAPLFMPSDPGPALTIDGVTEEVTIEGIDFEVPDAVGPGGTALTALINASSNVRLVGVTLIAGAGQNGANGTLEEFEYAVQSTLNGHAEIDSPSGGNKTCTCQTGFSSTGGIGGSPVAGGQSGSTGQPDHGGGDGGLAGVACNSGGGGGDGSNGPDAPAAPGADTLGNASALGWNPAKGTDGATGSPGQGGGGGGSRNDLGHGGGGGCGGCGGNGGKGGQGGGASIALLVMDSSVKLERCTFITGKAGNGGAGHAGQPGQQDVGAGGGVISMLNSCGGGNGGRGGAGGAGGGGAGGISTGILWKGQTAPNVIEPMYMLGSAGLAGEGGAGTNHGVAGTAEEVLEAP
jgi:hypothetical protein